MTKILFANILVELDVEERVGSYYQIVILKDILQMSGGLVVDASAQSHIATVPIICFK